LKKRRKTKRKTRFRNQKRTIATPKAKVKRQETILAMAMTMVVEKRKKLGVKTLKTRRAR